MRLEENVHYKKMMQLAPFGFIDPLTDLGTFNDRQMAFKEPVEALVDSFSGKPYTEQWYDTLNQLRAEYVLWQRDLIDHDDEKFSRQSYTNHEDFDANVRPVIEMYLRLGFSFETVAGIVGYSQKTLRNLYRRSDLVETHEPVIWSKADLKVNRHRKAKHLHPKMRW